MQSQNKVLYEQHYQILPADIFKHNFAQVVGNMVKTMWLAHYKNQRGRIASSVGYGKAASDNRGARLTTLMVEQDDGDPEFIVVMLEESEATIAACEDGFPTVLRLQFYRVKNYPAMTRGDLQETDDGELEYTADMLPDAAKDLFHFFQHGTIRRL